MFIDVDYSKRKYKSKIQLAKPNKTIITNLSEKFDDNVSLKFGGIHELNFSIPHTIDDGYVVKENPNIHLIKEKMILKLVNGTQSEWFIIEEINEDGDDDTVFNVLAYSLGYELSHKRISNYQEDTIRCEDLLKDLLKNTGWSIGVIDSKFINMSRAFDNSSNSLEAVIQAGETFGAIVEWDTENRKVSFKDVSYIGKYKGLSVNYGKLLKSISRTRTTDELVTRLYIYGNEDLSIHSVNPTGQAYIEDFSFYMHPFERDTNNNVLKSSYFMSDELCHALLNQSGLLNSESENIRELVESITAKQSIIVVEESALYGLELDLESINYRLDTAKAVENAELIASIEVEKTAKLAEINAQQTKVDQLKSEYLTLQLDLESKRASILTGSGFTSELLEELNLFIIEKEWRDDRYIDVEELYNGGLEKFLEMRTPKVVITVSIENLFDIIEEQRNWDKLVLGDSIKVKYPQMNIEYMARIIEINQDFEGGDISVTLANTNTVGDEMEQLKVLLSKSQTASTMIQNSKHKLDKIAYVEGELTKLINEEWDANKNKITAGVNNQIEIGSRGIMIRNPDMPNEVVIMQSGIIALSKDGGDTWKTAIKPDGIIAERLVGKVILGTRLIIEDEQGIMRFSGSLQEIFDNEGNVKVAIGKYEEGKYGMRIDNGAIEIVNGLPKEQIDPIAVGAWDSAEQNAKEYADAMKLSIDAEVTDIISSVTDLRTEMNGTFADGIITEAEAKSLGVYINILNNEKSDLDKRYILVYNDTSLSATPKTSLQTAMTAFSLSHNELITLIQNAIADGYGTVTEKNSIDTKFVDYRSKLTDVNNKFDIAITNIEEVKNGKVLLDAKQYTNAELGGYVTAVTYGQDLAEIQNQLDGSITTWFYDYDPTLTNAPASTWTDTATKNVHLGDLFYNNLTGYAYRYTLTSTVYSWKKITDTDVTKALQDASKAQDTADSKRRVFVVQPIPPYDIGDLWVQGVNGNIMKAKTAKLAGAVYALVDWELASKYTDDTRAIQAETNAKTYADGLKVELQGEIGDVETALGNLDVEIKGTFADGLISEAEAVSISKYKNLLDTEKSDIDSRYNTVYADVELVGTTKTALNTKKTAYNTAHTNLVNSINTAIADGKTTTVESADVDTKFASYRTALSELSKAFEDAVDAIAQTKATKALTDANAFTQGKIDSVNLEFDDVDLRIAGLKNFTDIAFKDSVLDMAERESMKVHIEQLNNEKSDIDAKYNQVYADTFLTGTPKTNLLDAKTNATTGFDKAHTDLIGAINTAVADNVITDAEKTTVNNAFITYRTRMTTLSTRFEEAIRATEQAKIDAIQIGGRNLYPNSGLFTSLTNWTGVTIIEENGIPILTGTGTPTNINDIPLKPNTEYVFSAKMKFNVDFPITYSTPNHIYVRYAGDTSSSALEGVFTLEGGNRTLLANKWEVITLKFKTKADPLKTPMLKFHSYTSATASTKYIEWVKLEIGNKATDWTPAPEDINAQIALVNQDISEVDSRITSLNTYIDGAFEDGVIEQSEAKAIEKYINNINTEKLDVDNRYNIVYANTFLKDASKTNLLDAKTSYNTSFTNLINSINTAIADGKTTVAEKSDVDSKFALYRTATGVLSTRFEESIIAIEKARVDAVQVGGRNLFANSQKVIMSPNNTGTGASVFMTNETVPYTRVTATNPLSVYHWYQAELSPDFVFPATITISVDVRTSTASTGTLTSRDNIATFENTGTSFSLLANEWKRVSHTITFTRGSVGNNRLFNLTSSILVLDVRNVKIEVGNKATDWTPAPEDIDKKISDVETSVGTVRTDLRLTAPLPTSIAMNASGITATTTGDVNKFARLDYRGLYIQGGAIDIRTSATANRGTVLDANGLRGYDNSGVITFEINSSGVATYNGIVNANQITVGKLQASQIETSQLIVGTTVTMGASATINWSQVSSKPYIPTTASELGAMAISTYIDGSGVYTGQVRANNIVAGTISGVTVDVSNAGMTNTDSVSTSVRFWAGSTHASRYSAPFRVLQSGAVYATNIAISGNSTFAGNINGATITGGHFILSGGILDVSAGSIIWGTNMPQASYASTAGSANYLNGSYTWQDFSLNGHVHADYVYVKPHTGQSLKLWHNNSTKGRIYNYDNRTYVEFTGVTGSF